MPCIEQSAKVDYERKINHMVIVLKSLDKTLLKISGFALLLLVCLLFFFVFDVIYLEETTMSPVN